MKLSTVFGVALAAATTAFGAAIEANDKEFEGMLKSGAPILLDLYAPWCGHCKRLAPTYDELADRFAHAKDKVHIVKMDGERNRKTSKKFNLEYFPTVKFIDGDGNDEEVKIRDLEGLTTFVEEKTGVKSKIQYKPDDSNVVQLDQGELEPFVKKTSDPLFVAFTATWCGHCKNLKPDWEKVADVFSKDKITIAQVDCTSGGTVCGDYAGGFPTLLLWDGVSADPKPYNGPRSVPALVDFVNREAGVGRGADGKLTGSAGLIPALDEAIKTELSDVTSAAYSAFADKIAKLSAKYDGEFKKTAEKYERIARKAAESEGYIEREITRVEGLLEQADKIATEKLDNLQRRLNILKMFKVREGILRGNDKIEKDDL